MVNNSQILRMLCNYRVKSGKMGQTGFYITLHHIIVPTNVLYMVLFSVSGNKSAAAKTTTCCILLTYNQHIFTYFLWESLE